MKYKKIALLFPGQGSQYVGMGKEFYEHFPFVKEIYDEASEILGYDLTDLCFKEHKLARFIHHGLDLNKTVYTQPAVFITSYAAYRVFEERCKEEGIDPSIFILAGHSLGEYTALTVAGVMDYRDTLRVVVKRAEFMTEAGRSYPESGLMAVVSKRNDIDYQRLCELCKEYSLYISLNNTKRQVVVGGPKKKMDELSKRLKKLGEIGRILKVEGPFHTPIMRPAAAKLKKELEGEDMKIALRPIMANVAAEAIVDPKHIREELYSQLYHVVNWRGGIERVIENGCDLFIEIGPKKVLSNMMKDIDSSIPVLNVEDMESLERTLNTLKQ